MFDFPLEICSLLSLSQHWLWKLENKFGCLTPKEQVDSGKDIEMTEVLLTPSTVSKIEFLLETGAVEGLTHEELQEKLDEKEKKE